MKPRLPPAPWTPEDTDIWVRVLKRRGVYWYGTLLQYFQGGDRRDADLMLLAQQSPLARFVDIVGEHWAVSMVPFASAVYRWKLVRLRPDPHYGLEFNISNCA